MPSLEAIIAVAVAGLALSATPGPSMFYVLSRSVGQSRAAGLASAIGLGLGGVALAVGAAFGLAAVFQQSAWAMDILKIAGSVYLVYLGAQMIIEARANSREEFEIQTVQQRSFADIVWQGVMVEMLNPKTVLFFVLFIPPFIEASGNGQSGDIVLQMLVLGAIVPLTAVPSDLFVAFLGGSVAQTVNENKRARLALSWLGGLVLIAIALNLHFEMI